MTREVKSFLPRRVCNSVGFLREEVVGARDLILILAVLIAVLTSLILSS